MDSGYFDNNLLDGISDEGHTYLVKVKFKGLRKILTLQQWNQDKEAPTISTCEFHHTFTVQSDEGKKIKIT